MADKTKEVESIQNAINIRAENTLNAKLDEHMSHVQFFNNINFGQCRMDELFKLYSKGGKFEDMTIADALRCMRLRFYDRTFGGYQESATQKLLNDLRDFRVKEDTADDDLPF